MSNFGQSDAWMFLAVAYATRQEPATLDRLYAAADHINCDVPSVSEIEGGINRLASAGLVDIQNNSFVLTPRGTELFNRIRNESPWPRMQLEPAERHLRNDQFPSVTRQHWVLEPQAAEQAFQEYEAHVQGARKR